MTPLQPSADNPSRGVVDEETIAVLRRIKAALPDVGVNGWMAGVKALDTTIAALEWQAAALPAVPEGFVSREVLRNLIDDEIASWSKSDQRREVTHAMACLIQRLAATPAHDQPEGSDND